MQRTWRTVGRILALLTLIVCSAGAGEWVALGPFGGDVRSLAFDAANPDRIFLGTSAGRMYLSLDGGTTWARFAQFGEDGGYVIDHILVDPRYPETIYAAAWRLEGGGDLFRTRDGGKTWIAAPDLHGKSIRALAMAPSDRRVLVAGALDGVFRSTDAGESWQRISPADHAEIKNVESIAIDPYHPELIYAGTWHLPWKTSDGGKTWRSIKNGIVDDSDVFSIFVDPTRPTVLYLSACTGIYRSNNTGELFRKVQGIPDSARRTRVIRQDPANPETVYAGTTEGLWKTTDGGQKWQRLTAANLVVNDILIDPRQGSRVLLATERSGVLASNDGGITFAASNPGFAHRQVTAVVVDSGDPKVIYASVINDRDHGGVFVSQDAGAHWAQLNAGLEGRDVFALHQAEDGDLLAGTGRGVFALRKGASLWQPINVILESKAQPRRRGSRVQKFSYTQSNLVARVAQFETIGSKWLAATSAGLFASLDEGASWHSVALPGERTILAVSALGKMVAAASPRAVFLSRDQGATWKRTQLPTYVSAVYGVAVMPGNRLWMITTQGAFSSGDGGRNWQHVIAGVPARNLGSIAYDAEGRRLLAASMSSGEIFQSTDGGSTWNRWTDAGFPIRRLLISRGMVVAATTFDGIIARTEIAPEAAQPAATSGKR